MSDINKSKWWLYPRHHLGCKLIHKSHENIDKGNKQKFATRYEDNLRCSWSKYRYLIY